MSKIEIYPLDEIRSWTNCSLDLESGAPGKVIPCSSADSESVMASIYQIYTEHLFWWMPIYELYLAYRNLFLKSWISRISVGRHICIRKGTHSSNQNTCVHLNSLGRRWEVFISATSSFKLAQKRLYLRFAQESNIRYSMHGTRNQYAVVWNLIRKW